MNMLLIVLLMGGLFGVQEQEHTVDDTPFEQIYTPVPVMKPYCNDPCLMSQSGYQLVMFFEGFSPVKYKCPAGLWTIGFGHVILPNESFPAVITGKEAEQLLSKDMRRFESAVNKRVTVGLKQHQFDAVTSFTFNLGEGALSQSTLLKKVNAAAHSEVPDQFRRWVYAKKEVLRGLVIRREAEAKLYSEGKW